MAESATITAAIIAAIGTLAGALAYGIRAYVLSRARQPEIVVDEQVVEVGGTPGHPVITVRSRGNTHAQAPELVVARDAGFSPAETKLVQEVSKAWLTFSQRQKQRATIRSASPMLEAAGAESETDADAPPPLKPRRAAWLGDGASLPSPGSPQSGPGSA